MRSIKEKELLVNFSKAFGQDVDPALLEEVNSWFRHKPLKKYAPKRPYPIPPPLPTGPQN
jgi:hypothetical protein